MRINSLLLLAATAVVGIGLSGCGIPAKITGGGSMGSTSDNPKAKAHIGFTASDCEPNGEFFSGQGQLNFIDKDAPGFNKGVKFHGEVLEALQCVPDETADEGVGCGLCALALAQEHPEEFSDEIEAFAFLVEFGFKGISLEYRSTNPKESGEGFAVVCAADFGEGSNSTLDGLHGATILAALEGPYDGYFNISPVKGNVQMHSCTCTDGLDNDDDGVTDEADLDCQFEDGTFNPNGDENTPDDPS